MKFVWRIWPIAAAFAVLLTVPAAWADGRKVVLVSKIAVDEALSGRLPAAYSGEALRRELEVALETTGLFTAATRDRHDLDPVLDELARSKHRSKGAVQTAQLILNPTLEGFSLAERRRRTPMMRGKDSVSVSGTIAMTVQVLNVLDGSVQTRMQIDFPYQTPERLTDPLTNDPLAQSSVFNGPPTPEELKSAYEEMGRLFAKRVLDQVDPTLVAQKTGDLVYLTRGEDSGYHVGDLLRVMRRGAEIRNPVTHEVLDRIDEQIAEVKVVEVRPRVTIAQIVKSSKDVVAGDIVREPVSTED